MKCIHDVLNGLAISDWWDKGRFIVYWTRNEPGHIDDTWQPRIAKEWEEYEAETILFGSKYLWYGIELGQRCRKGGWTGVL